MRELWILRHAKAAWDGGTEGDFGRRLSDGGAQSASRIGAWMRQRLATPDALLCSPAVRSCETAERVRAELGPQAPAIGYDKRIYEASLGQLLTVLAEAPAAARLLLVGHNPGLQRLIGHLCDDPRALADGVPTASLTVLTLPDDWADLQPGVAALQTCMRPGLLEPPGVE